MMNMSIWLQILSVSTNKYNSKGEIFVLVHNLERLAWQRSCSFGQPAGAWEWQKRRRRFMFTVNMAEASSNQWQGWTYRKWCACGWSDSWPQYSTDELSRCVFLHPLSHYPSFLGPTFLFQISWYTHTLNLILYLTVLLSLYQSLISHFWGVTKVIAIHRDGNVDK